MAIDRNDAFMALVFGTDRIRFLAMALGSAFLVQSARGALAIITEIAAAILIAETLLISAFTFKTIRFRTFRIIFALNFRTESMMTQYITGTIITAGTLIFGAQTI
jgi:hypothetical protein